MPAPLLRVTGCTSTSEKLGLEATSVSPLAVTDSTVGAAVAGWDWMTIELYLSVNPTAPLASVRAQPSGTLTVNVPSAEGAATKAWLSGMSPGSTTSGALGSIAPGAGAAKVPGTVDGDVGAVDGDVGAAVVADGWPSVVATPGSAATEVCNTATVDVEALLLDEVHDAARTANDRAAAMGTSLRDVMSPPYEPAVEQRSRLCPALGKKLARTARGRLQSLYGVAVAAERILLVEDDQRIGSTLLRALQGAGYDARWEQTGRAAVAAAAQDRPHLVLLDLGLPDMDGLDVCRVVHGIDADLVVIMLTARDEELDVVVGLDAGAVDYIAKPFQLAELLARIRAQLRHRLVEAPDALLAVGDLSIDVEARQAMLGTATLVLRAKEFDLLARLMLDAGRVVTREALMADVWDEHWFGSTKTLDFHIGALRGKIDVAGQPSRITTLRGVGFRLEVT